MFNTPQQFQDGPTSPRRGSLRARLFTAAAAAALSLTGLALLHAQPGAEPDAPEQRQTPRQAARPRLQVIRDVVYAKVPVRGEEQLKDMLLDLYIPQGKPPAAAPKPDQPATDDADAAPAADRPGLVVWVHGGAWRAGSKDGCPLLYLTAQGYAVASINYRLSQQAIFPAQIHDCKAAIRFLRANAEKYGYDARRIGVSGGSAGGHLVALLGTSGDVKELEGAFGVADVSSRVQAVVDIFGPSDFTTLAAQSPPDSRFKHDDPESPGSKLIGGPIPDNLDKARAASPVTYISANDPPFLIIHGEADKVVPAAQSKQLHEALQQARVESTLHIIEGAEHGGPPFGTPEIRGKITEFFDRHLKQEPPEEK